MAKEPRPQVVTAQIYIEPGTESMERTRGYVLQAVKASCRNIRDGAVLIVLYDEDEHLIGVDVTGTPSEELQSAIDSMTDKFEAPRS